MIVTTVISVGRDNRDAAHVEPNGADVVLRRARLVEVTLVLTERVEFR